MREIPLIGLIGRYTQKTKLIHIVALEQKVGVRIKL